MDWERGFFGVFSTIWDLIWSAAVLMLFFWVLTQILENQSRNYNDKHREDQFSMLDFQSNYCINNELTIILLYSYYINININYVLFKTTRGNL